MSAGQLTQGRRISPSVDGSWKELQPGDYVKAPMKDGTFRWFARCPGQEDLGDLSGHSITEHEDGTITVSPSILHKEYRESDGLWHEWHGFLERGVWREA